MNFSSIMGTREAGRIIGKSDRQMRHMIETGAIRSMKMGNKHVITLQELQRYELSRAQAEGKVAVSSQPFDLRL